MPEYQFGDTKYSQSAMVLGQWGQLLDLLRDVTIPETITPLQLADLLKERLLLPLAVVLNPEGIPLKDKDLPVIAKDLEFSMTPDDAMTVIKDFFVCNPLPSLVEKFGEAAGIFHAMFQSKTPLTPSSSPSAEETSQNENPSSGE